MKKTLSVILILALTLSLFVTTGCSSFNSTDSGTPDVPENSNFSTTDGPIGDLAAFEMECELARTSKKLTYAGVSGTSEALDVLIAAKIIHYEDGSYQSLDKVSYADAANVLEAIGGSSIEKSEDTITKGVLVKELLLLLGYYGTQNEFGGEDDLAAVEEMTKKVKIAGYGDLLSGLADTDLQGEVTWDDLVFLVWEAYAMAEKVTFDELRGDYAGQREPVKLCDAQGLTEEVFLSPEGFNYRRWNVNGVVATDSYFVDRIVGRYVVDYDWCGQNIYDDCAPFKTFDVYSNMLGKNVKSINMFWNQEVIAYTTFYESYLEWFTETDDEKIIETCAGLIFYFVDSYYEYDIVAPNGLSDSHALFTGNAIYTGGPDGITDKLIQFHPELSVVKEVRPADEAGKNTVSSLIYSSSDWYGGRTLPVDTSEDVSEGDVLVSFPGNDPTWGGGIFAWNLQDSLDKYVNVKISEIMTSENTNYNDGRIITHIRVDDELLTMPYDYMGGSDLDDIYNLNDRTYTVKEGGLLDEGGLEKNYTVYAYNGFVMACFLSE